MLRNLEVRDSNEQELLIVSCQQVLLCTQMGTENKASKQAPTMQAFFPIP